MHTLRKLLLLLLGILPMPGGADTSASPPPEDRPADTWFDQTHELIDQRTLSGLRRFDDAFGMQDYPAQASYSLRAITELRLDDQGGMSPGLRLRASVALPQISQRVSLIFDGDQQEAPMMQGLRNIRENAVALRWIALNLQQLRIDTDAGIRSGPDLFVRARLRRLWKPTEVDQIRLLQTVRYGVQEGARSLTETDYTHVFPNRILAGGYHVLDLRHEDAACPCWTRGLLVGRALDARTVVSAGIGQDGVSQPAWMAQSRYVWWRWREQFLRDWLFWEVEPRLTQARERDWQTEPSLVLRLEVRFGKMAPPVSLMERLAPPAADSPRSPLSP